MKKYLKYSLLPALALGVIGVGTASAHGLFWGGAQADPQSFAQAQTQRFQNEADLLGISLDELKNAWAEGKSIKDIAEEKGITQEQLQEKMKTAAQAHMKANLQALVDQGVITQAQADLRLQNMESRMQNGNMMRRHHGFGF